MRSNRTGLKSDCNIFMQIAYCSDLDSLSRIHFIEGYCGTADCLDVCDLYMMVRQCLTNDVNILLNLSLRHLSDFIGSGIENSRSRGLEVAKVIIFLE